MDAVTNCRIVDIVLTWRTHPQAVTQMHALFIYSKRAYSCCQSLPNAGKCNNFQQFLGRWQATNCNLIESRSPGNYKIKLHRPWFAWVQITKNKGLEGKHTISAARRNMNEFQSIEFIKFSVIYQIWIQWTLSGLKYNCDNSHIQIKACTQIVSSEITTTYKVMVCFLNHPLQEFLVLF